MWVSLLPFSSFSRPLFCFALNYYWLIRVPHLTQGKYSQYDEKYKSQNKTLKKRYTRVARFRVRHIHRVWMKQKTEMKICIRMLCFLCTNINSWYVRKAISVHFLLTQWSCVSFSYIVSMAYAIKCINTHTKSISWNLHERFQYVKKVFPSICDCSLPGLIGNYANVFRSFFFSSLISI